MYSGYSFMNENKAYIWQIFKINIYEKNKIPVNVCAFASANNVCKMY